MFVGVVLGLHRLFFIWERKRGDRDHLSISLPM